MIGRQLQLMYAFTRFEYESIYHHNCTILMHVIMNAIAIVAMLFFFNIPELSCISGKDIPSLAFHMGAAGRPEAFFPGFGWISGENRSRKLRLRPMFFLGVLSIAESQRTLLAA